VGGVRCAERGWWDAGAGVACEQLVIQAAQ
jgi:hypothetical protein